MKWHNRCMAKARSANGAQIALSAQLRNSWRKSARISWQRSMALALSASAKTKMAKASAWLSSISWREANRRRGGEISNGALAASAAGLRQHQ